MNDPNSIDAVPKSVHADAAAKEHMVYYVAAV